MPEPLRLNLGAGIFPLAGYVNIDAEPGVEPDICATVPPIPCDDGTVSMIYAGHLLEHFAPAAGQVLLRECHRVLQPGGRLTVVVPDTRAIMRRWLGASSYAVTSPEGRVWRVADLDDVCDFWLFSSFQASPHRWAYDETTLTRAVERAGFRVVGMVDRYQDPRLSDPNWWQLGVEAVQA